LVHADSTRALPARIEALATAAGLGRAAAHSQLAAAVDVVIHLRRDHLARRQLAAVGVVRAGPDGLAVVADALVRRQSGGYATGPAWPGLAELLALPAGSMDAQ
jgi:pilus assembly protein CpaF